MTLALLVIGLAVPALGFAAWPLLVRRPVLGAPAPDDDERAALDAEKRIALQALRELELDHQAGHLDEADHAALRSGAEARAAAVLRRLDALVPAGRPVPRSQGQPADGPSPWTRRPAVLGAAGAGLLVFGLVLGLLVARHTAPTPPETALGGPGGAPDRDGPGAARAGGDGPPRPLPKEMLEGMLRAAHQSLDAGRYREAIAAYRAVLARDPRNVDAITHLGVILAQAGHHADALEAFDRALEIDPRYAHALWDKAGVLEALADDAGLVTALERFVHVAPAGPDRDRAQERIRAARSRLAGGPGAPAARPAPPAGGAAAPVPGARR